MTYGVVVCCPVGVAVDDKRIQFLSTDHCWIGCLSAGCVVDVAEGVVVGCPVGFLEDDEQIQFLSTDHCRLTLVVLLVDAGCVVG